MVELTRNIYIKNERKIKWNKAKIQAWHESRGLIFIVFVLLVFQKFVGARSVTVLLVSQLSLNIIMKRFRPLNLNGLYMILAEDVFGLLS